MTTIWIDPVELDAMAATIRTLAEQVENATAAVSSTCCCAVPPDIADYVTGELSCIEACGAQTNFGLGTAAGDIATRAGQIAADQSLATATSSAFGPGVPEGGVFGTWLAPMAAPVMTSDIAAGIIGGASVIGGSTPWGMSGADINAVMAGAGVVGPSSGGIASLPGPIFDIVSNGIANINGTILAPNGLTWHNGAYVDSGGDRSNNLAGAHIDSSGRYDL